MSDPPKHSGLFRVNQPVCTPLIMLTAWLGGDRICCGDGVYCFVIFVIMVALSSYEEFYNDGMHQNLYVVRIHDLA